VIEDAFFNKNEIRLLENGNLVLDRFNDNFLIPSVSFPHMQIQIESTKMDSD
jgi:hypothetical protein